MSQRQWQPGVRAGYRFGGRVGVQLFAQQRACFLQWGQASPRMQRSRLLCALASSEEIAIVPLTAMMAAIKKGRILALQHRSVATPLFDLATARLSNLPHLRAEAQGSDLRPDQSTQRLRGSLFITRARAGLSPLDAPS